MMRKLTPLSFELTCVARTALLEMSTAVTLAPQCAATIASNVVSVLGGTVHVAVLAESATYTPATTTTSSGTPGTPGTPGTSSGGPSLASTGLSHTIPVVAALFVVAALAVLHRRRMTIEQ